MSSPEASVILGAAVIDDVMGLFVLAFLAASCSSAGADAFGVAPPFPIGSIITLHGLAGIPSLSK